MDIVYNHVQPVYLERVILETQGSGSPPSLPRLCVDNLVSVVRAFGASWLQVLTATATWVCPWPGTIWGPIWYLLTNR